MSIYKEATPGNHPPNIRRATIRNKIMSEQSKPAPQILKSKSPNEEIAKITTYEEAETVINKKIKHEQKSFEDNELEFLSILTQDAISKKVAHNNWSGMDLIPSFFEVNPEREKEIVKELNNIDREIWMKGMKGWVIN